MEDLSLGEGLWRAAPEPATGLRPWLRRAARRAAATPVRGAGASAPCPYNSGIPLPIYLNQQGFPTGIPLPIY